MLSCAGRGSNRSCLRKVPRVDQAAGGRAANEVPGLVHALAVGSQRDGLLHPIRDFTLGSFFPRCANAFRPANVTPFPDCPLLDHTPGRDFLIELSQWQDGHLDRSRGDGGKSLGVLVETGTVEDLEQYGAASLALDLLLELHHVARDELAGGCSRVTLILTGSAAQTNGGSKRSTANSPRRHAFVTTNSLALPSATPKLIDDLGICHSERAIKPLRDRRRID